MSFLEEHPGSAGASMKMLKIVHFAWDTDGKRHTLIEEIDISIEVTPEEEAEDRIRIQRWVQKWRDRIKEEYPPGTKASEAGFGQLASKSRMLKPKRWW